MSLVAWYPLIANGNNQGLDGTNLTVNGSVTYTAGKLGNAATFVGTNTYFKRVRFTEQKNFSVSAWVKCSTTSSSSQYCFTQGRDINSDSWRISFSPNGTTIVFCIGNQNLSYTVTLNTWYHVTMTIDDDANFVFYLNGTAVKSGTVTVLPDYSESGGIMAIGAHYYASGAGYVLNGQIQDFRYYDHALSVKEVKELAKGLCLHIPLDWGGNPNMISNSYTWMNKALGAVNQWTNSGITYATPTVTWDDNAPSPWVYSVTATNSKTTSVSGVGSFYRIYNMGLTTADLVEGENYTFSFWAKSDSGITNGLAYGSIGESQTGVSYTGFGTLDSNWRKHTRTFKWTRTTSLTLCFYVPVPASSTVDFQICGLKLEKGDKATPYIPKSTETAYTSYGYGDKFKEDCSGYNNVAIVTGSAMTNASGASRGSGTNWNGSGRLVYSTGMPVGTQTLFTINTWLRTTSGATQPRYNDVYGFTLQSNNGTNRYTRCELEQTDGSKIHWYGVGDSSYQFAGDMAITTGEWTMVTLVSDGEKFHTYKNGVLYKTLTPSSDKLNWKTLGSLTIGDEVAGNVYYDQADFRVYTTALSADDIKSLYQTGASIAKNGALMTGQLVEE